MSARARGLVISFVTAAFVVAGAYLVYEADQPETVPHETLPAPGDGINAPGGDGISVRERLLRSSPQQLGLVPVRGVWGVLVERGYAKGVATVVALTDGTASMYISTGGSVTGGKVYAPARAAAQKLCEQAADSLKDLQPAKDFPPPAKAHVRFYVLADGGVRTAEREIHLPGHDAGGDPLVSLASAGDALLDALKEATSKGYIH